MTKEELKKQIYQTSHLTGRFLLRSGEYSTEYFDKYKFESNPKILKAIAKELTALVPKGTQILAGLEMGAIPIVTALSIELNLPCVFVRKKSKEYGTSKIIEGLEVQSKKLCIIEDIITTGGQVILSLKDLRKEGAIISDVICVINRSPSPIQKFSDNNLQLKSLFIKKDFDNCK